MEKIEEERIALSKYRLEQAEQCLKTAKLILEYGDFKGAANRSYYAIYHAIRSVIALDGKEFVKHSGNNTYFRSEYIKTGIFDVELSDIITSAFTVRNASDYNDFFVIAKEDAVAQVEQAVKFYDAVKKYLFEVRYIELGKES